MMYVLYKYIYASCRIPHRISMESIYLMSIPVE